MAKMTFGAKRKARRLASKRAIQAQDARHAREPRPPVEDPRRTVLAARQRHLGISSEAAAEWMLAEPVGRAIRALAGGVTPEAKAADAKRLWATWLELDAAHAAYMRRIVGCPRHATAQRIEMLSERMDAHDGHLADLRTDARKDEDARAGWGHWQRRLAQLNAAERRLLMDAIYAPEGVYRDGGCTTAAAPFVRALRFVTSLTRRL